MTAHMVWRGKGRRRSRSFLLAPLAGLIVLVAAAGSFIAYLLWPTWPNAATPLHAPAVPVTVAGVALTECGIVAICQRDGVHQAIPLLQLRLPAPAPAPGGVEWIEAYRHWAR